jgi:prepilin signal peptidase PulO-like enzyme (type II secretory pathway)
MPIAFFVGASLIFGLIIGSFLNCLIWRLYKNETIMGRSYCPHCRAQLAWYDNIPLGSFIWLKGRCRHCQQPISWQYPAVELLTAVLFAGSFWQVMNGLGMNLDVTVIPFYYWASLLRDWLAVAVLIIVFVFDARWLLVPVDVLWWTMPVLIFFGFWTFPFGLGAYLVALAITGLIAFIFFGLQYFITKGRGLGEGDIWLGIFLASLFPQLSFWLTAILTAYLIGSVVGLLLVASGRKKLTSRLPLGVFLAPGALIALFYGNLIIQWFSHLMF